MTDLTTAFKAVLYAECDPVCATLYEAKNATKQRKQMDAKTLLYLADLADDKTRSQEELVGELARCSYKRRAEASQLMNHLNSGFRKDALRERLRKKVEAKKR